MNRCTRSVLHRPPSSLGRTPDISIPRVKIPPEVPSPWANVRPASSRACTTPACHATRIPPPASTSARRDSSGTGLTLRDQDGRDERSGRGVERGEGKRLLAESLRTNAAPHCDRGTELGHERPAQRDSSGPGARRLTSAGSV